MSRPIVDVIRTIGRELADRDTRATPQPQTVPGTQTGPQTAPGLGRRPGRS